MTRSSDVVIIGAGPSGLLAALRASKKHQVLLLEKPDKNFRIGKRILVSGNGRANFFNEALLNLDTELLSDYASYFPVGTGEKLLSYLFDEFGFTFRKDGDLYYPYFNRSECLLTPLEEKVMNNKNITILKERAIRVEGHTLITKDEAKKENRITFSSLVVAIGGRSYDRKDYDQTLIKSLGVKSYPFSPALCPIKVLEKIPKCLKGNRLKGKLTLSYGKEILHEEEGELLFKEDGLSGICVFNTTVYLENHRRTHKGGRYTFTFDYGGKDASLASYPYFLRHYLEEMNLVKGEPLRFTFDSLYPFEESQISYGGVLLSEIEPKRFSLKKDPNLYVIGEALDINLPCGGFNMGLALMEGYLIGGML